MTTEIPVIYGSEKLRQARQSTPSGGGGGEGGYRGAFQRAGFNGILARRIARKLFYSGEKNSDRFEKEKFFSVCSLLLETK